jgi:hypothetical protein
MRITVRGLKRYRDRQGNWRIYHRRSGTPIDPSLTGTALAAEVERLDKLHAPKEAKAGTLAALLESYKKVPRFTNLAARTKEDYHKAMDYLKPLGPTPLTVIDQPFIARLRDRTVAKKRAGFTNHMLAMLSSAFRHGKEYGLVEANPCAELEKAQITKDRRKPNRPWSPAERIAVLAAAPPHLKVPLALARFLGMRRGDILKLPDMAYRDGHLTFTTSKTGKKMKLPVLGELREILDARPRGRKVTMLCVNSRGDAWTEMGFTASMKKFFARCVKLGLAGEGLTMHGQRHSVAAELRSLGYSLDQIKDFLGQETVAVTDHYSSSADVSGVLIDMANVIQARTKRKRVLSNGPRKSV